MCGLYCDVTISKLGKAVTIFCHQPLLAVLQCMVGNRNPCRLFGGRGVRFTKHKVVCTLSLYNSSTEEPDSGQRAFIGRIDISMEPILRKVTEKLPCGCVIRNKKICLLWSTVNRIMKRLIRALRIHSQIDSTVCARVMDEFQMSNSRTCTCYYTRYNR